MSNLDPTKYVPWDQDKKLPPPPWDSTDPAVIAWEQAHGHDVRLKCYPEFGCLVISSSLEEENERLRMELEELRSEVRLLKKESE